jgi:chromosomal replication initiator protein
VGLFRHVCDQCSFIKVQLIPIPGVFMNAKDAWLATLGQLQIQLNRSTYDTWLRHADLLGYEDGRFVVTVPHAYAKDWIERHLIDSMTRSLSDIFRRPCELQIIVWDPVDEDSPLIVEQALLNPELFAGLNPAYTFDNLVTGQGNNYAALLARAIVDSPSGKYSPVLFYGDMGMGKTHLLQAIARALIERGDKVIYVTAEAFTTELVAAIRNQNNAAFRDKYRLADAVLIDDVQFIEGKTSSQSELVAVWDALRNRQRTIIFASDRLPADMTKISKDARSRLQAGPIASIDTPDLQMRRDLIAAFADRRKLTLATEVRDLIASRGEVSAREIEAAVEQLHTYSQLTRQIITETVARSVLHMRGAVSVSTSFNNNRISAANTSMSSNASRLDAVLEATARYYRLSVSDLASRQRTRDVALARQLAMYIAREETDASLIQIGDALGGRDHSTVMHGCAKIADSLIYDNQLAQDIANIRQSLGMTSGITNTPANTTPHDEIDWDSALVLEPVKKTTSRPKRMMWE